MALFFYTCRTLFAFWSKMCACPSHKGGGNHVAPTFATHAMRKLDHRSHSPNTYSIEATDMVLSSGNSASVCDVCRDPTSTAIYCLPLTE